MSLSETARRIRAFLDTSHREDSDAEANRRVFTYPTEDLTGIYYDDIQGFPARSIGFATQAAVAGQLPFVQLFNAVGSGLDLVIERCQFLSGTAQNFQLRGNAAALGAAGGTKNRRDFRSSSDGGGVIRIGTEAAASGFQVARSENATNSRFEFVDILVTPGTGLHIEGETVNSTLTVTWWWRAFSPGRRQRA